MRKRRVVGRIYGMKCSSKGHKDRNRNKDRIKRSRKALLVYVKDICQRHKPQHPHHVKVSPWGPNFDDFSNCICRTIAESNPVINGFRRRSLVSKFGTSPKSQHVDDAGLSPMRAEIFTGYPTAKYTYVKFPLNCRAARWPRGSGDVH